MTPLGLLLLICGLAIARLALMFAPRARASLPVAGADPGATVKDGSLRTVVREYLDAFIVAGLAALLLITFVMRPYFIPSESMVPTLLVHDVLLVTKFEYKLRAPSDGDVVVFPPPIASDYDFIKRLMGKPGDTLRIAGGIVYRNGVALAEPYVAEKPNYDLEIKDYSIYVNGTRMDPAQGNVPPRERWTAPDTIPPNCYFMMGDNRNDSDDSHLWGFAQSDGTFATGPQAGKPAGLTGHAFLIFWPLDRFRLLH